MEETKRALARGGRSLTSHDSLFVRNELNAEAKLTVCLIVRRQAIISSHGDDDDSGGAEGVRSYGSGGGVCFATDEDRRPKTDLEQKWVRRGAFYIGGGDARWAWGRRLLGDVVGTRVVSFCNGKSGAAGARNSRREERRRRMQLPQFSSVASHIHPFVEGKEPYYTVPSFKLHQENLRPFLNIESNPYMREVHVQRAI